MTTFKPLGISSTFISMESLISDIQDWMIENILGINDSKTDFTVINGYNITYSWWGGHHIVYMYKSSRCAYRQYAQYEKNPDQWRI